MNFETVNNLIDAVSGYRTWKEELDKEKKKLAQIENNIHSAEKYVRLYEDKIKKFSKEVGEV